MIKKLKVILNKITYWFKVLDWARTHWKAVENYKFLTELRRVAYEKMLKMERESQIEKAQKLEIQIKLIDKILGYING